MKISEKTAYYLKFIRSNPNMDNKTIAKNLKIKAGYVQKLKSRYKRRLSVHRNLVPKKNAFKNKYSEKDKASALKVEVYVMPQECAPLITFLAQNKFYFKTITSNKTNIDFSFKINHTDDHKTAYEIKKYCFSLWQKKYAVNFNGKSKGLRVYLLAAICHNLHVNLNFSATVISTVLSCSISNASRYLTKMNAILIMNPKDRDKDFLSKTAYTEHYLIQNKFFKK